MLAYIEKGCCVIAARVDKNKLVFCYNITKPSAKVKCGRYQGQIHNAFIGNYARIEILVLHTRPT